MMKCFIDAKIAYMTTMFSINTDYFHQQGHSLMDLNSDIILFDLDFNRIRYFSPQYYN